MGKSEKLCRLLTRWAMSSLGHERVESLKEFPGRKTPYFQNTTKKENAPFDFSVHQMDIRFDMSSF